MIFENYFGGQIFGIKGGGTDSPVMPNELWESNAVTAEQR